MQLTTWSGSRLASFRIGWLRADPLPHALRLGEG